jgi:hypothetical protein
MRKQRSIKNPCRARKPDGSACQVSALPGSEFCFFHDPARAEERRTAQSFGGSQNRMRTLASDTPDVKLVDSKDVVALISETISQVRRGEIDPRVANTVGYLVNILIKAVEQGELEGRLAELEALVKTRGNHYPDLELTEAL